MIRHAVELGVKEQSRTIETIKRELEVNFKKERLVQMNLKKSQDELEAFQVSEQQHSHAVLTNTNVF